MNVLSLFDGISVARQAFHNADIPINKYYACEIDKYAIQVSKKNWPDNIHLGSVVDFSNTSLGIDFLIGGSPCQDLSIAKKGRKGLDGERSGLFWEYVRIKELLKPKYFILENVASMPKKDRDIITEVMGVEPIMFNASLVSAQCRKRLFWTNIQFNLPTDKGILLKDILQEDAEIDERMITKGKAYVLTASYAGAIVSNSIEKKQRTMVKVATMGKNYSQGNSVYSTEAKSISLSARSGGLRSNTGLYHINPLLSFDSSNNLICKEGTKKGFAIVNDGDSIDLSYANSAINGKSMRRGRVGDKVKNLMTTNNIHTYTKGTIRKLTPIECERLQSLPDDYTLGISNTQRYKCLGNAFNCEVIKHIINSI